MVILLSGGAIPRGMFVKHARHYMKMRLGFPGHQLNDGPGKLLQIAELLEYKRLDLGAVKLNGVHHMLVSQ